MNQQLKQLLHLLVFELGRKDLNSHKNKNVTVSDGVFVFAPPPGRAQESRGRDPMTSNNLF